MLKFYREHLSHAAQYRWMKEHPVQYIVLNVVLLGALLLWIWWDDRKMRREFELRDEYIAQKVKEFEEEPI